jgi:hypothetical protein
MASKTRFGLAIEWCAVGVPVVSLAGLLTGPPHSWTEDGLLSLGISAGLPLYLHNHHII